MVRNIVYYLVKVGLHELDPIDIKYILENRITLPIIGTSPPEGLFLESIRFDFNKIPNRLETYGEVNNFE